VKYEGSRDCGRESDPSVGPSGDEGKVEAYGPGDDR